MSQVSILCSFLFISMCISASHCSPPSKHQIELREHFEHLSYIAAFQCHDPQPRVVPTKYLLSEYETRGKAYFPDVTVLHRCDAAVGCCPEDGHFCGPVHADSVRLPFKVTYLEDMGDHKRGSWEMEYHPLDNHTACGCFAPVTVPSATVVYVHHMYSDNQQPDGNQQTDGSRLGETPEVPTEENSASVTQENVIDESYVQGGFQ